MFTGLVDGVGTITKAAETSAGMELTISAPYRDLMEGESVAISGACLTVRAIQESSFTTAAVGTTLGRTNIGSWQRGTRVNLERAMRADSRLGGHLVQGHVDGVAVVTGVREEGDALLIDIELPIEVRDLVVPLGSIAVDGVSLTVNACPGPSVVQLSIIEYTRRHTTLGDLREGSSVHVEADLVAKYVQRMVAPYLSEPLAP